MQVTALHKSTPLKNKLLKIHIAGANNRPLCGGGPGGKQQTGWQTDLEGLSAVNCLRCLKAALKAAPKQNDETVEQIAA